MAGEITWGATSVAALPTLGGGSVRPGRVFCVGRNFEAHAREMGGDPEREPPFFFAKPADALCWRPRAWPLPAASVDVQHEVELAIVLCRGGADLDAAAAEAAIGWHSVAIDMTRRDLQAAAKASGRPWALAKGFDHSAPIGTLARWPGGAAQHAALALRVNGELRQAASLADMVWSPAEIVAALSRSVTLAPGDVVLCGTPAGVAALAVGDRLEATLGEARLAFDVRASGEALTPATAPDDVLDFWFGPGERIARWFGKDAEFDAAIAARFGEDVAAGRRGELDHWATTPRGRLALVILLDQFSRNIHRGAADAFAADAHALGHARAAVERGEDRLLDVVERAFLYLPFEHAESMAMQDRACALYAQMHAEGPERERGMLATMLDYAERHRVLIARFGRFPHRNAVLGRTSTEQEAAYLATPGAGF